MAPSRTTTSLAPAASGPTIDDSRSPFVLADAGAGESEADDDDGVDSEEADAAPLTPPPPPLISAVRLTV